MQTGLPATRIASRATGMLLLRASSDISCVSWQIERALENDALHRGRKRKSETSSGHNDWTLEDDKALIRLVWSGAQGDDRKLPGRTARACKNRLQMIHKHVPKSWTHLHKQAPSITCIAERIMADTAWYEMIAAERQKLPKLSQDETLDKNGPGFLGSSDHAMYEWRGRGGKYCVHKTETVCTHPQGSGKSPPLGRSLKPSYLPSYFRAARCVRTSTAKKKEPRESCRHVWHGFVKWLLHAVECITAYSANRARQGNGFLPATLLFFVR